MLPVLGMGLFATVANAAKNLFSGEAKQARQERKEAKQVAKATAKKAKEVAKELITGGAKGGAVVGDLFAKIRAFFEKNWQYILIIGGALLVIWYMFFRKKRRSSPRRRRTLKTVFSRRGRGSTAMKRKMARVRAAKKRKR